MFCSIGKYISLELFDFVNLTSSCSLVPQQRQEILTVKGRRHHLFIKAIQKLTFNGKVWEARIRIEIQFSLVCLTRNASARLTRIKFYWATDVRNTNTEDRNRLRGYERHRAGLLFIVTKQRRNMTRRGLYCS